jgi:DNA-binding response OmpR family regulator
MRVLVVEDDVKLAGPIQRALRTQDTEGLELHSGDAPVITWLLHPSGDR